jgi:hypothetical protein
MDGSRRQLMDGSRRQLMDGSREWQRRPAPALARGDAAVRLGERGHLRPGYRARPKKSSLKIALNRRTLPVGNQRKCRSLAPDWPAP